MGAFGSTKEAYCWQGPSGIQAHQIGWEGRTDGIVAVRHVIRAAGTFVIMVPLALLGARLLCGALRPQGLHSPSQCSHPPALAGANFCSLAAVKV